MKKSYIITIIVIITILSLFLYKKDNSIPKKKIDNSIYHLKTNMEFLYKLEYQSNISFNKDIDAKDSSISLKAKLSIKIINQNKKIISMALKLRDINISVGNKFLEEKLSTLYSKVIFIDMSRNGKFLSYYTPNNREDYKGLIGLYNLLEVVLKDKDKYQVLENSVLGDINSSYDRDKFLITKSRKIAKNSGYRFIYSKGDISLSKNLRWIDNILFKEKIEKINDNGYFLFKSNNKFKLLSIKLDNSIKKDSPKSLKVILKRYKKEKDNNQSSIFEEARVNTISQYFKSKSITIDKLIENSEDNNLTISKIMDIKDYLKIYPNSVSKVVEYIQKYPDSSISSALIHSLELADTKESQIALIKLLNQEDTSNLDRDRIIVAMGGLKNPTIDIINTLIDLSNQDSRETNTAIYMLGALYKSSSNIDIKDDIENRFREILEEGEDSKYLETIITAISQTDINKFENDIIGYIDSDNDSIKITTIEALSNSNSQEAYEKISSLITDNQSPKVLSNAINYLNPKEDDIEMEEKIVSILNTNKNQMVKNSAIKWLSKSVDIFPENRDILKNQLNQISNESILKDVIRAIR